MKTESNLQQEETEVARKKTSRPDTKNHISSKKATSFNPERQGGRLLSALNKATGVGNPYYNKDISLA